MFDLEVVNFVFKLCFKINRDNQKFFGLVIDIVRIFFYVLSERNMLYGVFNLIVVLIMKVEMVVLVLMLDGYQLMLMVIIYLIVKSMMDYFFDMEILFWDEDMDYVDDFFDVVFNLDCKEYQFF